MIVLSLGGGAMAALLLSDDWSFVRRFSVGAISGFGIGIIILSNRMLGAFEDNEHQ